MDEEDTGGNVWFGGYWGGSWDVEKEYEGDKTGGEGQKQEGEYTYCTLGAKLGRSGYVSRMVEMGPSEA